MNKWAYGAVATVLAFTLTGVTVKPTYASDDVSVANQGKGQTEHFNFSHKLYDSSMGNVIGEQETKVEKTLVVSEDGSKTVTLKRQNVENYNGVYGKVKTDVDVITITRSGEYYINGEKLSQEFLEQQMTVSGADQFVSPNYQSGGTSWLTYYQEVNRDYYKLTGYPDADFFLDNPIGTKRTWYTYGSYQVSSFQNYANIVNSCRADITLLSPVLVASLGYVVLTAETVIGAIVAGGSAAITATQIYNASSTAHSAMANAYSILKNAY